LVGFLSRIGLGIVGKSPGIDLGAKNVFETAGYYP
jgi:hypothetical protein